MTVKEYMKGRTQSVWCLHEQSSQPNRQAALDSHLEGQIMDFVFGLRENTGESKIKWKVFVWQESKGDKQLLCHYKEKKGKLPTQETISRK